jgi:hypothetical protein
MGESPLVRLDEAIHRFSTSINNDGSHVTGWVLAYQTSQVIDVPGYAPLVFGSGYSMGTATSTETAIGLLRLTSARLERMLLIEDDYE